MINKDKKRSDIMYVFKKIKDEDFYSHDCSSIIMQIDKGAGLDDLLMEFTYFLKACGYSPEGELEFVKEEDMNELYKRINDLEDELFDYQNPEITGEDIETSQMHVEKK